MLPDDKVDQLHRWWCLKLDTMFHLDHSIFLFTACRLRPVAPRCNCFFLPGCLATIFHVRSVVSVHLALAVLNSLPRAYLLCSRGLGGTPRGRWLLLSGVAIRPTSWGALQVYLPGSLPSASNSSPGFAPSTASSDYQHLFGCA